MCRPRQYLPLQTIPSRPPHPTSSPRGRHGCTCRGLAKLSETLDVDPLSGLGSRRVPRAGGRRVPEAAVVLGLLRLCRTPATMLVSPSAIDEPDPNSGP